MKVKVLPPMPLLRQGAGLRAMHMQSLLALLPLVVAVLVAWGLPALRLLLLSVTAFAGMEALVKALTGNRQRFRDGHALLNGLLLALLSPAGVDPLSFFGCALLGALVSEQLFGGLGRTPFHPALSSRLLLFLLVPASREASVQLSPFWWRATGWLSLPAPDAASSATAFDSSLAALKQLARIAAEQMEQQQSLQAISRLQEQLQLPGWREFFWNGTPGSLGTISLALIVPGAVLLFTRRVLDWKAPFLALLVFGAVLSLLKASGLVDSPPFLRVLVSTPLALLLVFYSSDSVFTPMTPRGRALYGLLLGLSLSLPVLLGLPETGLLLALPAAGLLVPWIDNWTLPRGPK